MAASGQPAGKPAIDGDELGGHRTAIDELDREILDRLNQRAAHARAIGLLKADSGGVAYRPEREAQVLARLLAENKGPLEGDAIAVVFRQIMSACLALEQRLRVAYLGPAGTFSHAAVGRHFGQFVEAVPCTTIDEVFRAVEAGQTDYAVVPVENSTEGAVGRTLDLMCTTELSVCGEIKLRVQQNVLSNAASLGDITKIYSHAQSLAQCVQWLAQTPASRAAHCGGEQRRSRAAAAAEPGAAAIAGEMRRDASTDSQCSHRTSRTSRTTRRASWCWAAARAGLRARQDLAGHVGAQSPGRGLRAAHALRAHGVSMTRFESRPARTGLWEYLFFVDIEGHRDDPSVAAALAELTQSRAVSQGAGLVPGGMFREPCHHGPKPPHDAPDTCARSRVTSRGKPIAELARELGLDPSRHRQARLERESARPEPEGARGDRASAPPS